MEKHGLSSGSVRITDSNFDDIVSKHKFVLIDFWAGWCPSCIMMAPVIEELAKEYAGRVLVGKLNVDENPETAKRFKILSIPTLLIMKDGREVERIVGFAHKDRVEAYLRKHLG